MHVFDGDITCFHGLEELNTVPASSAPQLFSLLVFCRIAWVNGHAAVPCHVAASHLVYAVTPQF